MAAAAPAGRSLALPLDVTDVAAVASAPAALSAQWGDIDVVLVVAGADTLRGLERGEIETHYPKRFTRWLKILRVLPYPLYFPLVRRITGL